MLEAEVTSSFILYVRSTEPWLNKKPKAEQLPFQVQGGCQEISHGILGIFSGKVKLNGWLFSFESRAAQTRINVDFQMERGWMIRHLLVNVNKCKSESLMGELHQCSKPSINSTMKCEWKGITSLKNSLISRLHLFNCSFLIDFEVIVWILIPGKKWQMRSRFVAFHTDIFLLFNIKDMCDSALCFVVEDCSDHGITWRNRLYFHLNPLNYQRKVV